MCSELIRNFALGLGQMSVCRPTSQAVARRAHTLLDTEDRYDAWNTGRDGPESHQDGEGLRISYDGTGSIPHVTFNGPDGEIELRGVSEIRAAWGALREGLRYAEAFGPPIPLDQWRRLQGDGGPGTADQ